MVLNMDHMFQEAKAFNGDISGWDVAKVANMTQMFASSGFAQTLCGAWIEPAGKAADIFSQSSGKLCPGEFMILRSGSRNHTRVRDTRSM